MNAAQHVHYMMALCRLTGRLKPIDTINACCASGAYTGPEFLRFRNRTMAAALVDFDRTITGRA